MSTLEDAYTMVQLNEALKQAQGGLQQAQAEIAGLKEKLAKAGVTLEEGKDAKPADPDPEGPADS